MLWNLLVFFPTVILNRSQIRIYKCLHWEYHTYFQMLRTLHYIYRDLFKVCQISVTAWNPKVEILENVLVWVIFFFFFSLSVTAWPLLGLSLILRDHNVLIYISFSEAELDSQVKARLRSALGSSRRHFSGSWDSGETWCDVASLMGYG